jgi:hypothetical protein
MLEIMAMATREDGMAAVLLVAETPTHQRAPAVRLIFVYYPEIGITRKGSIHELWLPVVAVVCQLTETTTMSTATQEV